MMRFYLTLLFGLCLSGMFGQDAMVQVIHNSPTPGTGGGPAVDIYLNGNSNMASPDIAGLAYRMATPYVGLPAGATQIHIVAQGGNPMSDTVLYAEATLAAGENYTIIANGVLGSSDTPFGLAVQAGTRMMSSDSSTNDLLIFHGSPDAPAVTIDAKDVATLTTDFEFGSFTEYVSVPTDDYIVDIRPAEDTTTIVGRWQAPLKTLNAGGAALTVFASGLLGNSPAFGLYATLPDGTTLALPDTMIASLQVIHNSPFEDQMGGPAVDVFVNGQAPTGGPLQNLGFREATPFIEVPGNADLTFDVVPTGGTIDQSIFNLPAGMLGNGTYVVMANGIAGNADTPFNLSVQAAARSFAGNGSVVDIQAFHGAPDAPAVDIDAIGIGQVIENLEFGAFNGEGYLSLPPDTYHLGIRASSSPTTLVSFKADISGLAGGAATVFASGFLANNMASPFGLLAALPDGTVVELPVENVARLQVVHAAPVSEFVDVWFNDDTKALENFEYETATPFITFPIDNSISITGPGSTDTTGNFLTIPGGTLAVGETYIVVAAGDNISDFGVEVLPTARERAQGGAGIDIQAFHGSPDAPAVDVRVRNAFPLFENLAPRQFGSEYVNVPEDTYLLDITLPGSEEALFTFLANLNGLEGGAALVFASGYASKTSAEIDSSFKLLAALPSGDIAELGRFDVAYANVIHASPAPAADSVDVYLDTIKILDNFPYLTATGYVELAANADIRINTKGSTGPEDGNVLTIPAGTLSKDSAHIVVVYGDGTTDFPIAVNFINDARATNSTPGFVDIIAFHGIPGVPNVDVRNGASLSFPVIIDDLGYGEFSDYLIGPESEYFFRFTPSGSLDGIATFQTEILESDESVALIATGNAGSSPDYNLYLVLPDGSVFASLPQSLVQIIHNSPVGAVDPADIWLSVNGTDIGSIQDVPFRAATGAGYIPSRVPFSVGVAPGNSNGSGDAVATFDVTFEDGKDYTVVAYGGTDASEDPVALGVETATRFAARGGNFDLQVFHGSPDAGTVDILANGSAVVDNFEYGTYRGYLELDGNAIEISIADESGSTIVGTWDAPVDDWIADGNTSGTVFASGLLTPEDGEPGFELWIAFSDGETERLEVVTSVNDLETLLTGLTVFPNPVTDISKVQYFVEESMDLQMRIISADGSIVEQQRLGTVIPGQYDLDINALNLDSGIYFLQMISDRGQLTRRIVVLK